MGASYTDVDRLILERWGEVMGLMQAHRDLQDRIEETVNTVGDRVARWARDLGYEVEADGRVGDFYAWRASWFDKRKGPMVKLVLGGFCPNGHRKVDEPYPFVWVYTDSLADFRVKEDGRIAFAQELRRSLGDRAKAWEDDRVEDADAPLGQYLEQYDEVKRCELVSDPDKLYDFAVEHLPKLFELGDVIDAALGQLKR